MNAIDSLIAQTIYERRIASGRSVDELSNLLGVSRSSMYRYENGSQEIPASVFLALSKILDFSADAVLDPELRGLPKDQQIIKILRKKADKLDLTKLLELNSTPAYTSVGQKLNRVRTKSSKIWDHHR